MNTRFQRIRAPSTARTEPRVSRYDWETINLKTCESVGPDHSTNAARLADEVIE